MGFLNAFRSVLLEALKNRTQQDLAKKAGVSQSTIADIAGGKDSRISTISKIVDQFTYKELSDLTRLTAPKAPIEIVDLEGLHTVHIYNIEKMGSVEELKSQDPVFTLRIPETFFPSDYGILMSGHAMEPLYIDKCAVGIREWLPGSKIASGEDYLCVLPFEGLVIRRVLVAQNQGSLEFSPLHPDKNNFRSQIFVSEEAEKKIFGRVTWVSRKV